MLISLFSVAKQLHTDSCVLVDRTCWFTGSSFWLIEPVDLTVRPFDWSNLWIYLVVLLVGQTCWFTGSSFWLVEPVDLPGRHSGWSNLLIYQAVLLVDRTYWFTGSSFRFVEHVDLAVVFPGDGCWGATTTFSSGVPQRISTRRCATKVKKAYHIPLLCDIWHLPGGGVGEACENHRRRNSATLTNWLCLVFGGPAVCGAPPKDIKLYYQSKGIAQRHRHKASMSGG